MGSLQVMHWFISETGVRWFKKHHYLKNETNFDWLASRCARIILIEVADFIPRLILLEPICSHCINFKRGVSIGRNGLLVDRKQILRDISTENEQLCGSDCKYLFDSIIKEYGRKSNVCPWLWTQYCYTFSNFRGHSGWLYHVNQNDFKRSFSLQIYNLVGITLKFG